MTSSNGAVPVTIAITRRADPSHAREMIAWMRAGTTLAEEFPGFLGAGWVRPGPGSTEWHMLYRFADADALRTWEESSQRQWWLSSAQGIVEHARTERRTGIEGWFDPPQEHSIEEARAPAPPRWKQAVTIWLVFFPLSLLANALAVRYLAGTVLVVRTLVITLCLTPLMTYLMLPWITRTLEWWLHGRPAPWRAAGR
ncbi:antibiotic biosynthesis monooxygenase [Catellatospora sichuanensis]|uniref:antibiotic biosynthesis monooxygenase n=1 Tax=Catellatospora sichuanensis TaxID=1969805 RepID=UPI001182B0DF|nr:antibiotic biosynthesis monooxygenase [Catellatospora sichuanensis]